MAERFNVQQVLQFRESAFGEYALSGTPTWTRGHYYRGPAEVTLTQERVPDTAALPWLSHKLPGHRGPLRCSLRLNQYNSGHGTTTAGALTQTPQNILLVGAFHGQQNNQAGTTIATTTDADSFSFTSATNWVSGNVGRVGSKGDTRGDGQAIIYNGANTGSRVALPAAPNNGDVVYSMQQLYVDDSVINPVTERFMVMHESTGSQFLLAGCAISDIEFNWAIGEHPTITTTWQGAAWREVSRTFPDTANAPAQQACAPTAAGSFFINDVGTSTRNTLTVSEVSLRMRLGLEPILAPGGLHTHQDIVGWVRTARDIECSFKIPYSESSAYRTWFDTANASLTKKHILWLASPVDGVATGFYLPTAFPAGNRPSQVQDVRGQNYIEVTVGAGKPDVSTDLVSSPIVLFQG